MATNVVKIDQQHLHRLTSLGHAVSYKIYCPVEAKCVNPNASKVANFQFTDFECLAHLVNRIRNSQLQGLVSLFDKLGKLTFEVHLHEFMLTCC